MPTPNQMETQILFFFFLLNKINSPIDLHSIHLIPIYLNFGPLLVTSAEMHNVVALKEEPDGMVAW